VTKFLNYGLNSEVVQKLRLELKNVDFRSIQGVKIEASPRYVRFLQHRSGRKDSFAIK